MAVTLAPVVSSISLKRKEDFSSLIFMPVVEHNRSSKALKFYNSSKFPTPYKITSSINNKWVRFREEETLTPTIFPLCCEFVISRLKLSIININTRGKRGKP